MKKTLGVLCIAIFVASLAWLLLVMQSSIRYDQATVRFGEGRAPEGTMLVVKEGELALHQSAGPLTVQAPIVGDVTKCLWAASALLALCAGVILVRREK